MNKRILATMVALPVITLVAGNHPVEAKPKTTTVTVRGDWLNDANCVPLSPPASNDGAVDLECEGSSAWGGDFDGREVAHLHITMSQSGRFDGSYTAVFTGVYLGDHSHGALDETGHFSVDEKGAFLARATIVGGTCDWAGSSGSIAFDGLAANGGYVGQWTRPATAPADDPTCVPVDHLP